MAAVITTAKKRHTAVMYTIRASTLGAKLDACSGYNGNCACTVSGCSLFGAAGRANVSPAEDQDAGDHHQDGRDSAEPDDSENGRAVPRGRRVVLKTVQKQVIDGRADFSRRRIDEAQTNVTRG